MSAPNPDPEIAAESETAPAGGRSNDLHTAPQASKFRFKSSSSRKRHRAETSYEDGDPEHRQERKHSKAHPDGSPTSSQRRRHHHRHHHRRSKRPPPTPPPAVDDDYHDKSLPPETAFRESLFDALADDEGAAFWEGVYGQPIHIYPHAQPTGPEGELEQMSEEEYATFVRGKMWEKTHQHVVEERERRAEETRKRKEREQARDSEGGKWEREVEASLKRGRERKERARWKDRWDEYAELWRSLGGVARGKEKEKGSGGIVMPWPTASGKFGSGEKGGDGEEVERFFREVARYAGLELLGVLKTERVRWHPDKMQQRLGGLISDVDGGSEKLMKRVTAVFQVVDRMWTSERDKAKEKESR